MTSPNRASDACVITIFHNPACGTSRNVLAAIREAGHEPRIVEYLRVGWRRDELLRLLHQMGLTARDILRVRGTPAVALGLTENSVSEAQILAAMVADPILVERPIVAGPKGAALCRPAERVRDLI